MPLDWSDFELTKQDYKGAHPQVGGTVPPVVSVVNKVSTRLAAEEAQDVITGEAHDDNATTEEPAGLG